MDEIILSNKDQFPTEEVIFSHIGKSKLIWQNLFQFIQSDYPEFNEEWRFYKDGGSWLMKVTRKSKTIFWISIIKNAFWVTFYFGDKAEPAIMESKISDELKTKFKEGKRFGKIRAVTLIMKRKKDIEFVKELILIKLKF
ncbi:MAG: DUF3788 family protein [Ignavibacteriae bacterium]|nr:DUF3788 family protein [Ignavibacteriota bacterium]NOG97473.1 DUF3788 family protein [Ignavibacteriota bacterium]